MKYYFIAFSFLMNASVMAMDNDQKTSSLSIKVGKQEAYSSSDEEPDEHYSSAEYPSSGEESDGEPTHLFPRSFRVLNLISPVGLAGLPAVEQYKALIEAIQRANPDLHLPVPKED